MTMELEFDPGKARSNFRKHGVTFEQAFTALHDERGILLAVAITLRGDLFRIISARKATRNETRFYAKRI